MAQITQILLFSRIPISQRLKITGLRMKVESMEVLGMCLPYVKMYFQDHQLSLFFSMAQLTQILLFLEVLLFEKLKITVTEQHLFKKKFLWKFWVCVNIT